MYLKAICFWLLVKNSQEAASKMVQQVKILTSNLSLILRTHMVEGENRLLQVVL